MDQATHRAAIEDTLMEIDRRLCGSASNAAVRELRVRHSGLSRVVRHWLHVPPHDAQIAAMLECVVELRGQVLRVCAPEGARKVSGSARAAGNPPPKEARRMARQSSRPAHRSAAEALSATRQGHTTRPPPGRDASMQTTRPPPARRSDVPPSRR